MDEEASFMKAIGDEWGASAPRLVFADWLDEHDQPAKAKFLRLECRLVRQSDSRRPRGDRHLAAARARFRQIGRTLDRHFLLSVSRVSAWGFGEVIEDGVKRILAGFASTPPRDRWERRVSAWLKAIPLGVDGMSYIMLDKHGTIFDVMLEGDTEDEWCAGDHGEPGVLGSYLRTRAKRRYPALWAEVERVGATLPRCPECGGRRSERTRCYECGGLGWVPDVDA
jgi:uncharacterized protein (TIGR02996 family)